MEFDQKRGPVPTPQTPSTIAVSMATIDDALSNLVLQIEREISTRGLITAESASELHSLRLGAEQLLAAQTDTSLAI